MKKFKKLFTMTIAVIILSLIAPSMLPGFGNNIGTAEAAAKLNYKNVTIMAGQSLKLKVNGTSKKVKWSSNKKSVATVTKNGKVKAKKKGTATITAKVGSKKYKCKVTVKKKAYGSITGTVLYHYNRYIGYRADAGSHVYVLNTLTKKIAGVKHM